MAEYWRADSPANPSDSHQHGEGEPKRGIISHLLFGYQSRSPLFIARPRTSSGYFSFDHPLQNFLLKTRNKTTQTPSPSSQTVSHAQRRLAQEHENFQHHEIGPAQAVRAGVLLAPAAMQEERWVGQELRRIGDEMNQDYTRSGRSRIGRSVCHWLALLVGRLLHILFRWR
ncbi:hypothetical protein SKAU_G00149450 [Synaphobranchus kaupii]|uniref:Bcl-x interacting BH3 domain-containing protein n=1 Tax=Synaphobranchus kaupii TaxID=118154 RepID=A0A9Q1FU83_SYNKA|nr:hypothetical protein SKAU_G00149450 [Synaphobranchus kaupii]